MNHIKLGFTVFNTICKDLNVKFIHPGNEQGHPRANVLDVQVDLSRTLPLGHGQEAWAMLFMSKVYILKTSTMPGPKLEFSNCSNN